MGRNNLKRIVSMLIRLIRRTDTVSEGSIAYEYRDAEYLYENTHELGGTTKPPPMRCLFLELWSPAALAATAARRWRTTDAVAESVSDVDS